MSLPDFTTPAPSLWPVALFASTFTFVLVALGRRIYRWLGVSERSSPGRRLVLAFALGAGTLQAVPLLLGSLGLLRPTTLVIFVVAIAVLLGRDLSCVIKRAIATGRAMRPPPRWLALWLFAMLPGAFAVLLLVLGPTFDNDGLIYHLTVPKRWLQTGYLSYLPTYPYSNTPMGAQSLFAIALVFAGDCAAKWLHFEAALFGGAAAYLVGEQVRGWTAGAAAATAQLLLYSLHQGTLGSAYIEGLLALVMCSALLAWTIWFCEGDRAWLRCSMLLAGISISFKITSLGFAIGLCGLTLAALYERSIGAEAHSNRRAAVTSSLQGMFVLVALVVLPVAPWLARATLLTGNPFFPMLAGNVTSKDLSGESAARFAQGMRLRNWGATVDWSLAKRQALLLGVGVTLALVAIAACVLMRRSIVTRAAIFACLGGSLLQLWTVGLNTRLWLPFLLAMAVPLIAVAAKLRTSRWVCAALVGTAVVGSVRHIRKVRDDTASSLVGLARSSFDAGARRAVLTRVRAAYGISEWANRELPLDARVLLANYPLGFYVDRSTLVLDFVQDALRLSSEAQFEADARRLRISHVVVRPSSGPDSLIDHTRVFEMVRHFAQKHGRLLVQVSDAELYAIEPSG